MQRYGVWSPEAQALGLPSYKPSFLFLAAVPLEVIHEFLLMRLEQKPVNPSPLSIRQLMRELKEGLKIATVQRERFVEYIETVLIGTSETKDVYQKNMDAFDDSLCKVFADYLDYVEKWALLQHESFQKSLLEEEWKFSCEIVKLIPGGETILGNKYSSIISSMLNGVGERLIEKIDELYANFKKDPQNEDDVTYKQNLFAVYRELQAVLSEEREMGVKIMAFCRSVTKANIIKDHDQLGKAVVTLKCVIPDAIDRVQTIGKDVIYDRLDDFEKNSLTSRARDILMQGYKFGFEFHKELSEWVPCQQREKLARSMVHFAHLWMTFVQERCERGRGLRPRWAYQGLDFLLTVCEPKNTKFLDDAEFEDLKKAMDACISHVIGTIAPHTPDSGLHSASPRPALDHMKSLQSRSRGSSPSPRPTYKSQRSNSSRKTSMEQQSPSTDDTDSCFSK